MEKRLLSEKEACKYLSVSRAFLARGRSEGTVGKRTPTPPWVKLGTAIRYSVDDLDAWIAEHRHTSLPNS